MTLSLGMETHSSLMEFHIITNRTTPVPFLGILGSIFLLFQISIENSFRNSEDSDLGLHCLPTSFKVPCATTLLINSDALEILKCTSRVSN